MFNVSAINRINTECQNLDSIENGEEIIADTDANESCKRKNIANFSKKKSELASKQKSNLNVSEFDAYLRASVASICPLQYWETYRNTYPKLYQVSNKLFDFL